MAYDRALLVGRFQPFHLGHLHAVRHALAAADRLLLGIGSSNRSREPENPFTAAERRSMILDSLDAEARGRVAIHDIPDVQNHIRWIGMIRDTLPDFDAVFTNDDITARLYRREGMPVCPIPYVDRPSLSGTAIRGRMSAGLSWEDLVPAGTVSAVRRVAGTGWPLGADPPGPDSAGDGPRTL